MTKPQGEEKYLEHIQMPKSKRFEKYHVPVTVVRLHGVIWRGDLLTWGKNKQTNIYNKLST